MTNYYCLVTGLPDLTLEDGKLSYSVADFRTEFYPELSKKDRKLIDLFYLQFDNRNLLRILKDKEAVIEENGVYSAEDLSGVIASLVEEKTPDKRIPAYFYKYAEKYMKASAEERTGMEDILYGYYYDYAMKCSNAFVAKWFELNLNINNVLAALAARKYKLDVSKAVVGSNKVAALLRTSNARDFGLSDEVECLEQLLRISEMCELVEREKKIDTLRWSWLEDRTFFHYFSIEKVFVFLMKLEMIGRWIALDKEKGNEMFRSLIERLKDEVQIPEEFRK